MSLSPHLAALEAEAIFILREAVAVSQRPVMMFSAGKDSSVLLHLALKAFYPGKLPFPLLHIDTTWKFREMVSFRDALAERHGIDMRVHTNHSAIARGISPITHGSSVYTDLMKTVALREAIDLGGYDCAIGGARRDEERSRAKERIFSVRSPGHTWDPKRQRPELWRLFNGRLKTGETLRVFPLSNWTEIDVWEYIAEEKIEVVSLYFSAPRPVVERNGLLIMCDDERLPLNEGERARMRTVRFRTLGCYPLSGAVESRAKDVGDIIEEIAGSRTSERQGRAIDHDGESSMEKKKQEGYF